MATILVRMTDRRVWARCGEVCKTRVFHAVMFYEQDGIRRLALQCPRCSSVTLVETPYSPKEPSHE